MCGQSGRAASDRSGFRLVRLTLAGGPTVPFPCVLETVTAEFAGPHILLVTLNRPDAANALNTQMGRDIYSVFQALLFDPGEVRCVVVTGAGRHFCAGGDIKERTGMADEAWRLQHVVFEQAFYAVMDCPIPVIAAVNGSAYGGGSELALACDFILSADDARFAFVETTLGIIPGGGGTQNLPRAVGLRRARELLFSGAPFSAADGLSWGMINAIHPADALLPEALAIAGKIAAAAPVAIRQAKTAMNRGYETDLKTGLAIEIEAYNRTVPTADRREGILAAREKRTPQFQGR